MKIRNKVILLTGGTSGVGLELLKLLVAQDNKVIVLASRHTVYEEVGKLSPNIDPVRFDLRKWEEIDSVMGELKQKYKKIDVLINNAAIQENRFLGEMGYPKEMIMEETTINFVSPVVLTKAYLASYGLKEESIIVNVNSGLAFAPKRTSAVYCATKAALSSCTRSLRYQYEGQKVRFISAYLPLVDTPMTKGRGSGKIPPSQAAIEIISGIENGIDEIYVGKVKILVMIKRFFPELAYRIMRRG